MSKSALALSLLSFCLPMARAEVSYAIPVHGTVAAAPAEWILVGREEDPLTGEYVYLWEWSEYPLRTTTFTKTPPPPPVDRQGIG
ncbi:MAG: hypothetical protein IPN34_09600 [Planctomycetes bacterium]|nr:hypothetical protein [Planctomycetota bacterium]